MLYDLHTPPKMDTIVNGCFVDKTIVTLLDRERHNKCLISFDSSTKMKLKSRKMGCLKSCYNYYTIRLYLHAIYVQQSTKHIFKKWLTGDVRYLIGFFLTLPYSATFRFLAPSFWAVFTASPRRPLVVWQCLVTVPFNVFVPTFFSAFCLLNFSCPNNKKRTKNHWNPNTNSGNIMYHPSANPPLFSATATRPESGGSSPSQKTWHLYVHAHVDEYVSQMTGNII